MKKPQLTEEILTQSNYRQLAALCSPLGIRFKNQDRQTLLGMLRRAAGIAEKKPKKITSADKEADKTSITKKFKADKPEVSTPQKPTKKGKSTSDRIRELSDQGLSVIQITKKLGVHYSFCHGVVQRHKK